MFLNNLVLLCHITFFGGCVGDGNLFLLVLFTTNCTISDLLALQCNMSGGVQCFIFLIFRFNLLCTASAGTSPTHRGGRLNVYVGFRVIMSTLLSVTDFMFVVVNCDGAFVPTPNDRNPSCRVNFICNHLFKTC